MSVPSLTKALHKITIQDVACDKVSFVALLGEDTFSYISRVMGMRGQLHGDVIVAFLDRMQNARAEELFFREVLFGAAVSILRGSQSKDLVVMEVCGGSGVLAQRICKYVQKPFSYILLERNLDSLQQAKKALHTEKRIQLVQTDVVVEGNFYVDEQKTTEIKEESVALCIGSGALTKSVLNNRPEALIVLDKIIKYLKRGGYLLLAGLTESFLHSNDFIDKGLRVLNTHASGYRPVYIVQKP